MKFLSLRPQPPKTRKDRLGNTISPTTQRPFVLNIWLSLIGGAGAGLIEKALKKSGFIQNDILLRLIGFPLSFGLLYLLNFGLNRFGWYRDFKLSPFLINGTYIIFVSVGLLLCISGFRGK